MSVRLKPLLLQVFSLALTASFVSGPASSGEAIAQIRKGELTNLVRQDCGSCHGMTLKGGLGKALLPQSLEPFSVEEIAEIILEGIPGTPMPPWAGLLSKGDARWIAKNLKDGTIHKGNARKNSNE